MLEILIPDNEFYNEETNEFVSIKEQKIRLEHSLVSVSKWESKWHKPFLSKDEKTLEESLDYIRCMITTQNVSPNVVYGLTDDHIKQISDYIQDTKTATWFKEDNTSRNGEIVTSELIYYWMIACNIPVEFQKWHLNRLLTLIRVCNVKNAPPKKMSKKALMNRNTSLNAARRKALNSKG